MRALAQDKVAAAIMGIRVNRLSTFTFVYTAIICGIAGILFGPIFFVSPTMGGPSLLKAFAAIVLGGWGNVPGAILGGLLIGLGETFFAGYVAAAFKDVFVFVLMVGFLLFRPQGILGQKISEKV
jgi:branched-chain amino acid transport system permease protein